MRPKEQILIPNQLTMVIFDWDGTLLDSSTAVILAHQMARQALELSPISEQTLEKYLGMEKQQVCTAMTQNTDMSWETYYEQFKKFYNKCQNNMQLFKESLPLLQLLKNQGITIALATNKSMHLTRSEMHSTQVSAYFDHCEYADQSAAKPDPKMLISCLNKLGGRPNNTLMIGDQTADIEAAHAARIKSITVCDTLPTWAADYSSTTSFCQHQVLLDALQTVYMPSL